MVSKVKKWNEAYEEADIATGKIAQVLIENKHLLPKKGRALDLACGRAANAILLAQQGFNVDAIDVSPVVLSKVEQYVQQQNIPIRCIVRDVEEHGLIQEKYDVIVVSYFLNRDLFQEIIKALRPNGLLFYETWSQQSIDESGPRNPAFRLKETELLSLSSPLRPVFYKEEGRCGDTSIGSRNIAMLVAQNC